MYMNLASELVVSLPAQQEPYHRLRRSILLLLRPHTNRSANADQLMMAPIHTGSVL